MPSVQRVTFLIVFVVCFTSCSSVRVTTNGSVPVSNINAEDEKVKTIWSIVGTNKTWNDKEDNEFLCDGAPVSEVSVRPNFIHSIISVVTIGIVNPIRVSYKCNEPCNN